MERFRKLRAKKMLKYKSAVRFAVVFALIAAGLISCVYIYFKGAERDTTGIVDKPIGVAVFAPGADELEPIKGIPDDVEEDYYVEVDDHTEEQIYRQKKADNDVTNILLIGTDIKNGSKYGRSDTMLLLSYDKGTETTKLISLMRDVWIYIPNHGMNRLNAAYAIGGVGLLINTINENFGLDIQNYVIVDFDRFKYIVDDIGGVEINITGEEAREINSSCLGVCAGLPEDGGQVLLNGAQALAHCRNRHSAGGDFDRTRRQRDFLFSLFERVKTECRISSLSDILLGNIRYVQTNVSLGTMLDLGVDAVMADRLSAEQGRIPFDGTWNYASKDGRSVVEIDREKNSVLLHEFLYGSKDSKPQQLPRQLLLAK